MISARFGKTAGFDFGGDGGPRAWHPLAMLFKNVGLRFLNQARRSVFAVLSKRILKSSKKLNAPSPVAQLLVRGIVVTLGPAPR